MDRHEEHIAQYKFDQRPLLFLRNAPEARVAGEKASLFVERGLEGLLGFR